MVNAFFTSELFDKFRPQMAMAYVPEVASTMSAIRTNEFGEDSEKEFHLLVSDFQTDGRGQQGNHWESQSGQNLLFTLRFFPTFLLPYRAFMLAEIAAIALVQTIDFCENVSIKWPNDIYVGEKKIAGMLIEHKFMGQEVAETIVGIGLNVNQTRFLSNAPNPVSLRNICDRSFDRQLLLAKFLGKFLSLYSALREHDFDSIHHLYKSLLFRRNGNHYYRKASGKVFAASLYDILPDGRISLREAETGRILSFGFKEISFVM